MFKIYCLPLTSGEITFPSIFVKLSPKSFTNSANSVTITTSWGYAKIDFSDALE